MRRFTYLAMVRRLVFGMILIVFGTVLILELPGCGTYTPAYMHSHCERWAGSFTSYGDHDDLKAYRRDLMSTCFARQGWTYTAGMQSRPEDVVSLEWTNAAITEGEYTQALGRDKANCIERGYVGQISRGEGRGVVIGSGYGIGGSKNESYKSEPVFNEELYKACMNGAGWEFGTPPANESPHELNTHGQGTAIPVD